MFKSMHLSSCLELEQTLNFKLHSPVQGIYRIFKENAVVSTSFFLMNTTGFDLIILFVK
jgi:hypothetical protein